MLPNRIYHIYNRGINKENIFKEEKNYDYFLKQFSKYLSPHLDVLAYCLMPNHFHFLIHIKDNNSEEGNPLLIKAFKDFFISYSKAINKSYDRTGSLFQRKFKRKLIDSEAYFTQIVPYIHHNPVKANLVSDYGEWKYSSYNAYVSLSSTQIDKKKVLEWFGGKDNFILSHKSYKGEDIDKWLKWDG